MHLLYKTTSKKAIKMKGTLSVDGFQIAYTKIKGKKALTILSMHGLLSSQSFPKVEQVKKTAQELDVDFISFDFPAHGDSSGRLEQWRIGLCLKVAQKVLDKMADPEKPVLVTGNSMGGWIAFLLAEKNPNIKGVLGISTGIDFTDFIWKKRLPFWAKWQLLRGKILGPNEKTRGYCFSKEMFQDAKKYFLLTRPVRFNRRVVFLQGKDDHWAPWQRTVKLMDRLT